ncbi:hypothetical protein [Streptomyces sp. NPDC047043]|uniref:glycosyl hydrolase family 95 catalytic domain-containing protein n=1 Tax=Streptomyces sp. NPDC047043 TaxID=3154497 RepID=UPI0033C5168D
MKRHRPRLLASAAAAGVLIASLSPVGTAGAAPVGAADGPTTAWRDGGFALDSASVVRESDVNLGRPNADPTQSLPLGNGSLGAATWAADGFTAQLNRADTLPKRLTPGIVSIPGLGRLTAAPDFAGHLDLYDGVLYETGGGMTAKAWVDSATDALVVDVTGADPASAQSARITLPSGRTANAQVSGATATLSSTWLDDVPRTGSGSTFGTLAGLTAAGRDVTARVAGPTTVQVDFRPAADGSFRVVTAAPRWAGGDPAKSAAKAIGDTARLPSRPLLARTSGSWHDFWEHTGLIRMTSSDGSAAYVENIRTMFLYANRAETRTSGNLPGSTSGAANLFNFLGDKQPFYPAAYWFWNLRQQVASNISSGDFALNLPVFNLYLSNLPNIEAWTRAHEGGLPGLCVPETMRFNGNGYQNDGTPDNDASCQNDHPTWNGQTITSGAEISLWIWQQYRATHDLAFLRTYYPLISGSARFLLAFPTQGADGLLHTVSNAHENQWNVKDPTTTIAAMKSLFPVAARAAELLHRDTDLARQLRAAVGHLPDFARTDAATHSKLLTAADDASPDTVIGTSYEPTAPYHNNENTGLEPVWPYNVIGDDSGALTELAVRTYRNRPNVNALDWTDDPIQAARLGLSDEVRTALLAGIAKYQPFVSGLGSWLGPTTLGPFIEHSGVVSTALGEALATDYDGILRIAPAWPSGWDAAGTVYVRDRTRVHVQVEDGTPVTVGIESGLDHRMSIRSPWPGQSVAVVDGRTGRTVVQAGTSATIALPARAGHTYLVQRTAVPTTGLPYQKVTGTVSSAAKHLGGRQIGLDPAKHYDSLAASFDNVGVTDDTNTASGDIDGGGASMSAQALATAGVTSGGTYRHDGVTFTWPTTGAGRPDNALATGQFVKVSGSGTKLGFLYVPTWGPLSGTGTIVYTDGTTQSYTLAGNDWQATPATGQDAPLVPAYQNRQGDTKADTPSYVYYSGVPLAAGKTVAQVQLPAVGPTPVVRGAELHVFAIAVGG